METKGERLSRLILEYLRKHPDAGDTVEGITKWWLETEKVDVTVAEIAIVMAEMVRKGVVTHHQTPKREMGVMSDIFYRVKEEKI